MKNPLQSGASFTTANRAWCYLTLGKEGHYDPKKASPMEEAAMRFFEGNRTLCKGGVFDLEEGIQKLYQQSDSKKASGDVYHILKTALRSARHAMKKSTGSEKAIGDLIARLEGEIAKITPTDKKRSLFERNPFKTSSQLKQEAQREASISWKSFLLLGGIVLGGGLLKGTNALFQNKFSENRSLLNSSLGADFAPFNDTLFFNLTGQEGVVQTFPQDFGLDIEPIATETSLPVEPTIEERVATERKAGTDNSIGQEGVVQTFPQDFGLDIEPIATETSLPVEPTIEERVAIARKADPEAQVPLYQALVDTLLLENRVDEAFSLTKAISHGNTKGRNLVYRHLIEGLLAKGQFERVKEIADQILLDIPLRQDVYQQIYDAEFAAGDFQKAIEMIPHLSVVYEDRKKLFKTIAEAQTSKKDFLGALSTLEKLKDRPKLYGEAFSSIVKKIEPADLTKAIKEELVEIANRRLWEVEGKEALFEQVIEKLVEAGDEDGAMRVCCTDKTPNSLLVKRLDEVLESEGPGIALSLLEAVKQPAKNEPKQRCPFTTYNPLQQKIQMELDKLIAASKA